MAGRELVCRRCGAPLPPGAAQAGFTCPRCGVALFEGRAHDVVLYGCGACGGIWLDNDGSQRVVKALDRDVVGLAERASQAARVHPDTRKGDLPCAACRQPMKRVRPGRMSLEIDVCSAHGTWFDRHELTLVAEGFAAERAMEQERQYQFYAEPVDPADVGVSTGTRAVLGVAAGALEILGAILSSGSK